MSTTYKVLAGDTFEIISRNVYGTELQADNISRANPGVIEPLTDGTTLVIPVDTTAPKDVISHAVSSDENEVAILIGGKRFRFWSEVRITRAMDAMDTVDFMAPFDADKPEFKDTFRPFSYKSVDITVGGNPLFTGTMIVVNPVIGPTRKELSVSGYSLPGVLNDCTPPASAFPLEFDNQDLKQIADSLAKPFGIGVEFLADQGAVFERVACEPGRKVLDFLIDLAKQRNLIISSSARGKLIFLQAIESGSPVTILRQGESPLLSVTPFFSPQDYYSHITGLQQVIIGSEGSQFTVKNSLLKGVIRPITFKAPDTSDSNVKDAVAAKAGRMFGNMASYSVKVATWRDPRGNLWEPNTIIKLQSKDAMIYSEYEFIIRLVEFTRGRDTEIAVLNLVIPGSFNGKVPEELPWD